MIKKIAAITCICIAMHIHSESNFELISKVNSALDAIKASKNEKEIRLLEDQAFSSIHLLEKKGALSAQSFKVQLNNEINKANRRIHGGEVSPQKNRPLPELPVKSSPPPVPPAGPPASAYQTPPPPAPPALPPAPSAPSDKQKLLEQIRAGKELRKAESPLQPTPPQEKTKADSSNRSDYLKAIQAGIQLRKTAPIDKKRAGQHELEDPLKKKVETKEEYMQGLKEREKERLEKIESATDQEWEE